ncbi:DNA topoisomerase 2-binding protein 1-B isoform X2 [Zootermopsis nevadensis]|uniref:DNA topoisomerase 2-binding protein 1 n=1 Tax=Zootermopsis nevadensis TaxID=136037 RepID=A0A067R0N1_ZOONE|nr:DNA topoisomerase 2-binding protein 1-B isoform X2 [Zootermopsis nevadensis]KDR12289.1 DNA topoisomerase 2-binding protein 1 [Zootermopsis nevadensis]
MSEEENVRIRFVVPKDLKGESLCSDDMKMAFQSCVEHELSPEWISEQSCASLEPSKQDVFVFQQFEGEIFSKYVNLKCVLLGPRCVLSCLMEGSPIPESCSPIFTTAMRGLVVTTTNFSGQEKEDLVNKIKYMGALFSSKLVGGTTHVVAKNVLSVKYEKAVERNLPIMTGQWVHSVWEASCKRNIHACDPEFQAYKCPVFHGLTITCSNLPRQQKEEIRKLINDNGGVFSGQLECDNTKLLVIANLTGEKYKYAREWKLPCVLPSWVCESAKEGYAVSVEPHLTPHKEVVRCSTPNPDETRLLPHYSMVSAITESDATHVNETAADTIIDSFLTKKVDVIRNAQTQPSGASNYSEILEKLDLTEAKKAGPFLDGCNVYLSGFNLEQSEKLRRVLNGGGATRFNEISDSVTHIIIGDIVPADLEPLKYTGFRPYILTVNWVTESMQLKCPAPEEAFLCSDALLQSVEPPSPLSKKGLQLLRRPNERPIPCLELASSMKTTSQSTEKTLPAVPVELVDQYLHNLKSDSDAFQDLGSGHVDKQSTEPADTTAVCHNPEQDSTQYTESTIVPVFSDLTFIIVDYEDEVKELLIDAIESRGGLVVGQTFRGIAHYAVVPLHGAKMSQTAVETVSYLWVEDCHHQDELMPVLYYHRPVSVDVNKQPLAGCVIGISSYTGKERDFIFALAQLLGAVTQETFARKSNEKKNALASTHLICCEPGSQKYNAALKWKLPAVSHEWLLACAKEGQRVNEDTYLVGESSRSINMPYKVTEAAKTDGSAAVQMKDDKSKPEGSIVDAQAAVPELKAVNKRVVELQTNTAMGPPSLPVTPSYKSRHGFSQESPLHIPKISESTPKNDTGWPGDPNQPTPKGPFSVSTPQTPYGQVLKPDPSPDTKKNWKKWIDNFPDFGKEIVSPKRKRKLSTPMSELKRRCWQMILPKDKQPIHDVATHSQNGIDSTANQVVPVSSNGKQTSCSGSPLVYRMDGEASSSQSLNPSHSTGVHTQLAQLNQLLSSRRSGSTDSEPKIKRVWPSEANVHEDHLDDVKQADPEIEQLRKESQGLVGWDDPIDVNELKRKSHSSQQPLKFMLSNVGDREYYESVILSLGGEVTGKHTFDPSATHLVCSRPGRSEKLLASIASGKWVLHKGYLDVCQKEKQFVQEDEFEWGNPSASSLMRDLKLDSLEHDLALSAYRWRRILTGDNTGAFMGMRAAVCISREREEPFKRLVLAGGGRLVDFSNLDEATHCFVELSKASLPVDLSVLVKKRIPCVPPLYLNDYLVKNPPPQAHNCVVPEYKLQLQAY